MSMNGLPILNTYVYILRNKKKTKQKIVEKMCAFSPTTAEKYP